jgi:transposase
VARKCEVVLLASKGLSNNAIAQQMAVSRPTVIATRAAFVRGGVEAIRQKQKQKGSRRVLAPALEQKILDTTCIWVYRARWCTGYGSVTKCNPTG